MYHPKVKSKYLDYDEEVPERADNQQEQTERAGVLTRVVFPVLVKDGSRLPGLLQ